MPRSRIRSGKLAAQTMSNALIASARNLTLRPPGPVKRIRGNEWQRSCWHSYDVVEVYHYAVQWVGNTLSRAKLTVTKNGKPTDDKYANQILNEFFGGPDQHGEFLRQAAVHMTVAGEGYLVEDRDGDEDWWGVVAAIEMRETATGYRFDGQELDADNALVMRFWRPHPVRPNQSDCPTRPLLPVLNQMEKLTMYVDAQLDSRLTGNGLMLFPNSMAFPVPSTDGEGDTSQQAGLLAFMKEWAEVMSAAKQDHASAAAMVPTAAMGEGEDLDKVRHLTTWTPLDEHAPALRDECVRRIALGLDMPADALLPAASDGGGENHWGAWQTDDSLIKAHAEPLLALITQALTSDYLRVRLTDEFGMAWEDADEFAIEADTADMRLRPNRSKEAIEMWDRGELNGVSLRRENGFDETDAMAGDEKKAWLLLKVAQGSPSPEYVQWAAAQLGIPVPPELMAQADEETRGERPLPRSLKEHPTQDPPERPAAAAELLAAGEMALFRCLERVGNRSKTIGALGTVPANVKAIDRYQYVMLTREQLNDAMIDAWSNLDRMTLPEGVMLSQFETALDNYARMLISSRNPYDRGLLGKYLALALKEAA